MAASGLFQIAAKVSDLDASIAFYRDKLGLPLIARFDPPGIAFFRIGPTRLMLDRNAPMGQFYVGVPSVDADRRRLIALGVPFESERILIHRDTAGQFGPPGEAEWMAFLRDPAGNLIGLVERGPA